MKARGSPPERPVARPEGDGPRPEAQKRAAVRLRLPSLAADLWAEEGGASRRLPCQVLNISEGGALVEARGSLDAEARIYCRIALPKGPRVETPASIVRLETLSGGGLRVGLRFEGMSLRRRDVLVRWIFGELAHRRR